MARRKARTSHRRRGRKTGHTRRRKVGALSMARDLNEILEFAFGAAVGAAVGRVGMSLFPSIDDQMKDIGYFAVGGGCIALSKSPAITGAGCGLIALAAVDTLQNMNIISGVEKVMAGLTGTTLVAGPNGKNMLLNPAQRQQLMNNRARLNGGGKVMAGGNRTPVSLVSGINSGYMAQGG